MATRRRINTGFTNAGAHQYRDGHSAQAMDPSVPEVGQGALALCGLVLPAGLDIGVGYSCRHVPSSLIGSEDLHLFGPTTPLCTESALNRLAPHGVGLYDVGGSIDPAHQGPVRD